jgi:hypothetical protein
LTPREMLRRLVKLQPLTPRRGLLT